MQINVTKIFHMNYHMKVMHINWSYDQTIIILWNPTIKLIIKVNP
jgi:hypothetical protein